MTEKAGTLWQQLSRKQVVLLILLGLAAGFLAGMFGVGGGVIIVPGLVLLAGFNQRLAAGTSLAAIVPLALVGVISYAAYGTVSWLGAALLAVGGVAGAQLGTWLLAKTPQKWLQIGFAAFILFSIAMLYVNVPTRDAALEIDVATGVALVVVGVFTGTLAGLLGVGGGVIVVTALMLLFGASDLVAKGTSLLMMIPSALGGTVGNLRRQNVNMPAALIIGLSASATTFLGAQIAFHVSPEAANLLFSSFLVVVAAQMLYRAFKHRSGKDVVG